MDSAKSLAPMGAISGTSIGMTAQDYKVGDTIKLVIFGYGGIQVFFPGNVLNPNDRLVEVTINSVKKVKEQEFIEI